MNYKDNLLRLINEEDGTFLTYGGFEVGGISLSIDDAVTALEDTEKRYPGANDNRFANMLTLTLINELHNIAVVLAAIETRLEENQGKEHEDGETV